MKINPRAGRPGIVSDLVDVPKLISTYYEDLPDPGIREQRIVFGTSGHRSSSLERSFMNGIFCRKVCAEPPGAQIYSVDTPVTRPASEYNPRIIPRHANAAVPLEASEILWQR
jgi:hypothetical protein